MKPGWIDNLFTALFRPWTMLLALGFILTPTYWLLAALNTGAAFLKIGAGARPAAMGGAYTALADDVNAIYYNPGALARLRRQELGATHAEWLLGTKFDFIGYAQPTSMGTFGLGITRLGVGSTEGRDANRQASGGFEASDTAYSFGLSRMLRQDALFSGMTSVGVNLKRIESRIGAYSAGTWACDFGGLHQFAGSRMSVGFSVLNAGPGMRFISQSDPLPLTVALGGAYRLGGALNLALDVRQEVYDKRMEVGIGSEYSVMPGFAVRAGYMSNARQAGGGGLTPLAGLGGGFGLKLGNYRADYTFTPFGEGQRARLSLGMRW